MPIQPRDIPPERNHLQSWMPPVFWLYLAALYTATHWPSEQLPEISTIDKYLHLGAYAVLGFLWVWGYPHDRTSRRRRWLRVSLPLWLRLSLPLWAFGIFDELTQIPVGRQAEVLDWIADAVGVVVGVNVGIFLQRLVHRNSTRMTP